MLPICRIRSENGHAGWRGGDAVAGLGAAMRNRAARWIAWIAWAGGALPGLATGQEPPVEDAAARAALPLWQVIPAASAAEFTPAADPAVSVDFKSWTVSHGDAGSRRYSALDQINRSNVQRLQVAWIYRSAGEAGKKSGWRGIQANPIVVDGVLYAPNADRAIVALDATTGCERWRFQVETPARLGLDDAPARRGLVYWPGRDGFAPRIIFASGSWIYALDPKTGRPVDGFGENGRTPFPVGGTAVGVIWEGTYIVPGLRGDIISYDLGTGRQLWRFHTIPKPGEFGVETWRGTARDGANCWGGVALDEGRGIVFAAIGAPQPNFTGVDRLGDNLFSNCLVAIDARTGRRLWHFQNVRHDLWDLDNPAPPNLATITRDGRRIDVVVCVTKTGSTLLLDRVSGKPVFPFRLRRAPVSTLPGEITAAYQPDPELPEPFASPEFKADEVTQRTPEAREHVLKQMQRMRQGWYEPYAEGVPTLFRSTRGGAEWTGASIDVPTGRLYVSSNHLVSITTLHRSDERERDPALPPSEGEKVYQAMCVACHGPRRQGTGMVPSLVGLKNRMSDEEAISLIQKGKGAMPPFPMLSGKQRNAVVDFLMRRNQPPSAPPKDGSDARYFEVAYKFLNDHEGYPGGQPPWGTLNCIDLNTGKLLWRVPLGEYEELTRQGVPRTGTENFGGPTVTAGGLVFCAGTKDEKIRAFDKDTGEELWSAKLPFGGYAPPATYEVDGRQYVVIAATGGGKPDTPTGDAWVAFALPPE